MRRTSGSGGDSAVPAVGVEGGHPCAAAFKADDRPTSTGSIRCGGLGARSPARAAAKTRARVTAGHHKRGLHKEVTTVTVAAVSSAVAAVAVLSALIERRYSRLHCCPLIAGFASRVRFPIPVLLVNRRLLLTYGGIDRPADVIVKDLLQRSPRQWVGR